jgi:hypothetical protein
MKKLACLGCFLCLTAILSTAQDKVFNWVRASNEVWQLDPMEFHAGRVYRPGSDGGNIHVDIRAKHPVTVSMVPSEQWDAALQHPDTPPLLDFICQREHVVDTTYECHLPNSRPMTLLLRDERGADRAVLHSVIAVLGHGAEHLVAPNALDITYYRWDCVQYCREPEFSWSVLVREKYQLSASPKVYSLLSPDRDGQPVWIRIKAPVPMTVAVMPSAMADKIYDNPEQLPSALESTTCKQRGVQSLSFDCTVNVADGRQSLVVIPETRGNVPHKKAEIEMQAQQCRANCDLLGKQQ